jgi:hypothetical protein
MPTGGDWTPLKNDATDFVQGTESADITPAGLVTNFIRAAGGLAAMLRGNGGTVPSGGGTGGRRSGAGADGGGASAVSSAAVGTARNLGGFLSSVADVGLERTLRDKGLEGFIGKSASDVADALLDEFAGPASTLDNALARESLAEIREEILSDAETFEDVEKKLSAAIDEIGIFGILASFFGHYIFKMFCRNFYEEWVKKVGEAKAGASLKEIEDYIRSSVRTKLTGQKITPAEWKKDEGKQITETVLRDTLEIFGVTG